MKIGISSTGANESAMTDPRFGRCDAFAIYDTQSKTFKFVDNDAKNSSGGAGIAAAQQLLNVEVEVVLTGNLGPNAYKVLAEAEIKAYRVGAMTLQEATEAFQQGKLDSISQAGQAHAGQRGGSIR